MPFGADLCLRAAGCGERLGIYQCAVGDKSNGFGNFLPLATYDLPITQCIMVSGATGMSVWMSPAFCIIGDATTTFVTNIVVIII